MLRIFDLPLKQSFFSCSDRISTSEALLYSRKLAETCYSVDQVLRMYSAFTCENEENEGGPLQKNKNKKSSDEKFR